MEKLETKIVKIKPEKISKAISKKFENYLDSLKDSEERKTELMNVVAEDEQCQLFAYLKVSIPKFKDLFQELLDKRIGVISPKYLAYLPYSEEKNIENKVTIYLMDNPTCTFDEIYTYCTKDIKLKKS